MEAISGLIQATPQDRSRCRSYRDYRWAFYRAFTWITEQNPNSKWTQAQGRITTILLVVIVFVYTIFSLFLPLELQVCSENFCSKSGITCS